MRQPVFHPATLMALLLISLPLTAQTAVPDASGNLVFKRNVHAVVVDIVVTGKNGQPVRGLKKEDFEVAENGQGQKVTYFEEHTSQTAPTNLPPLPPNVFTNLPRITPTDSVTVLLLDSLNTQIQDQSRVHAQMLKYLKTMQPGRRVAIFGLGNQLTLIQGFTDDSGLLAAALKNPKSGASPLNSSVLKSSGEVAAENQTLAMLAQAASGSGGNPNPEAAGALVALQSFMAEQTSGQGDLRVKMTFQAFQELANYLAGIPGRKNVIWFSSAFPTTLFPDPGASDGFAGVRQYVDEVRKTDALLTGAQVAIYPIAAEGLATDALYDIEQRAGSTVAGQSSTAPINLAVGGANQGQMMQQEQSNNVQVDASSRNASHNAMQEIARDTGGEAFFNTNGIDDAIARASDHGASYYTITYTPTTLEEDGRFRKIQIRTAKEAKLGGGIKLAYRRGYFANKAGDSAKLDAKLSTTQSGADPLHPFMGPGMPASTQIPLAVRIAKAPLTRAAASPASHAAGDNPEMAKVTGPVTRYSVDFVIAAKGLRLDEAANNGRHGLIESTIVVYSQDGRPMNWIVRQLDLDMDAAKYAQVQQNGANFRLVIDAPEHAVFLRCGIYDNLSNLAGTLEVPLTSVQTLPSAAHSSH